MPYISEEDRDEVVVSGPDNAGELNFSLTTVCLGYLGRKDNFKYQDLNDVIGALEGCKLEFYARVVRPYENGKALENGDVYDNSK